MSTQPEWLRRAQSQGWLSDAWKPVGDAEPSPLLAALVLLGALGCSVPLLGFLGVRSKKPYSEPHWATS
ncbi:hypothetical protein [Ottowia caeni]|uniref:hypothetical protein n=1 Tax=Ottowia caeni TaxID=2870339 RepID=UPI003D74E4F7